MKIKWSDEAIESYDETLDYWYYHNKSYDYSHKIISEVQKVKKEIKESPYFLAYYIEELRLYKRSFFKNKFSLYYEVNEEKEMIYIVYFRSNKQKPLYIEE
ncbi:type II toxin-antitoxin system RelE/ParE family toxin [Capnocytophaga sputigena]|jgi:hypothetical protein|uniref:type II toxin-antitoxin system RelE/ParE family toxin n=1 Tax=Capnocytophaga sputigena TaxID=1019 RepID=UPI00288AFEE7|nr:type II toxin-antitoxin system RelE/ParE family toxin [Capnocytophaga sputigena]